jgi:hypothetical protein
MNLGAGLGVAVREFATGIGPVDYALFVDRTLCGVLEAKPEGTTLSGFSDEAGRYIGSVPERLVRREGQVRFGYLASSTEILFRDHADPAPRPRRVFYFHRPETLRRWLSEPETIRARLQTMPSLDTVGLRDCQVEAVTGLEKSFAADEPRAVIQAATGAGRSFTELYNVQRLGPAGLDKDAAVVVATIQRVYSCAAQGRSHRRADARLARGKPPRVSGTDSTNTSGPYPIPSGWVWTTIGKAGQVLLGRQRAPQHHSGPNMRPFLRVANVLEDRIEISDVKRMNFTPSEFENINLNLETFFSMKDNPPTSLDVLLYFGGK